MFQGTEGYSLDLLEQRGSTVYAGNQGTDNLHADPYCQNFRRIEDIDGDSDSESTSQDNGVAVQGGD